MRGKVSRTKKINMGQYESEQISISLETEINSTQEMINLMSKVEKMLDLKTQQISGTDVRDIRELTPEEKEFLEEKMEELNLANVEKDKETEE